MKVSTSIEERKDPNFDRIMKELKKLNGSYVTVGIHQDAGEYKSGEDVVSVAIWNEFGTDTIPERSFFRSSIDGNEEKINKWREEAILGVLENGWTAEKSLENLGFKIQILIQNKIQSHPPPPNAPSTVEAKLRKGVAPNTLIDTGLMLRSVTYKVVMR